jgi:hypothetical protein
MWNIGLSPPCLWVLVTRPSSVAVRYSPAGAGAGFKRLRSKRTALTIRTIAARIVDRLSDPLGISSAAAPPPRNSSRRYRSKDGSLTLDPRAFASLA